MPDENELESATNLAVTLAWVAGAVVAAYLLGVVIYLGADAHRPPQRRGL